MMRLTRTGGEKKKKKKKKRPEHGENWRSSRANSDRHMQGRRQSQSPQLGEERGEKKEGPQNGHWSYHTSSGHVRVLNSP